jgi:hypothetical protein
MNEIQGQAHDGSRPFRITVQSLVVEGVALKKLVAKGSNAHCDSKSRLDLDRLEEFVIFFKQVVDICFPFIEIRATEKCVVGSDRIVVLDCLRIDILVRYSHSWRDATRFDSSVSLEKTYKDDDPVAEISQVIF